MANSFFHENGRIVHFPRVFHLYDMNIIHEILKLFEHLYFHSPHSISNEESTKGKGYGSHQLGNC